MVASLTISILVVSSLVVSLNSHHFTENKRWTVLDMLSNMQLVQRQFYFQTVLFLCHFEFPHHNFKAQNSVYAFLADIAPNNQPN